MNKSTKKVTRKKCKKTGMKYEYTLIVDDTDIITRDYIMAEDLMGAYDAAFETANRLNEKYGRNFIVQSVTAEGWDL